MNSTVLVGSQARAGIAATANATNVSAKAPLKPMVSFMTPPPVIESHSSASNQYASDARAFTTALVPFLLGDLAALRYCRMCRCSALILVNISELARKTYGFLRQAWTYRDSWPLNRAGCNRGSVELRQSPRTRRACSSINDCEVPVQVR